MASKLALVIIFNHQYNKNIPVLESIYKGRFSNIFYLVPFYDGDKANVIPVYEKSFYFQGYLAQGFKHYFSEEIEHYFFVADDLMLNPLINEDNYKEHFKLNDQSCFIPEIFTLDHLTNKNTLRFEAMSTLPGSEAKLFWWRIKMAARYQHNKEGNEISNEMPSYSEAEIILKRHGYPVQPLRYQDVNGALFPFKIKTHENRLHLAKYFFNIKALNKKYRLSYPMVGSYSDILIVSKKAIRKFCHYCGVFAANELFVELAIPTALLLASDVVVTEPLLDKRGEIYWTYTDEETAVYNSKMQQYHFSLQELLEKFPKNSLYIHPVKLSKWSIPAV